MTADLREMLLPCPCGRNARISAIDSAGRRSVSCDDEDCFWSITAFSNEQVVERWNRRSPAALSARDGWVQVPEEITQQMRDAGNKAIRGCETEPAIKHADRAFYAYAAMLAAAPTPGKGEGDG